MQIKERDSETGQLKQTFTEVDPSKPTETIGSIKAENADLKSRLADVELALADLFTGGGV